MMYSFHQSFTALGPAQLQGYAATEYFSQWQYSFQLKAVLPLAESLWEHNNTLVKLFLGVFGPPKISHQHPMVTLIMHRETH